MGVIDPDLIKFYRCQTWAEGSTHGGDIDLNAEITTATDQNIFDDVTDNERESGDVEYRNCLLYTSPSPRDLSTSRMPSSA